MVPFIDEAGLDPTPKPVLGNPRKMQKGDVMEFAKLKNNGFMLMSSKSTDFSEKKNTYDFSVKVHLLHIFCFNKNTAVMTLFSTKLNFSQLVNS